MGEKGEGIKQIKKRMDTLSSMVMTRGKVEWEEVSTQFNIGVIFNLCATRTFKTCNT